MPETEALAAQKIASIRVTRGGVLGTVVVLVVAAVCVRLGLWQLDRREQRQALNAAVAARYDAPPLQLALPVRDTTGLTFRRVRVAGHFDAEHAVVLAGRSHRGVPGVHLLMPLRTGAGALLVNRGWTRSADARSVDLERFATSGQVEVLGLVRTFGERRQERAAGGTDEFQRIWYTLDPSMLEQFPYDVPPFYVQALPDAAPAGEPVPLPPPDLSAGPHLGYALQWFSFAAIALIGWIALAARSGAVQVRELNRRVGE